jgi:hypothetical protein
MRISFGISSCKSYKGSNKFVRNVCDIILSKIEDVSKLTYEQLSSFDEYEYETSYIDNKDFILTTYKNELDNNDILIIVQGFYQTLVFPNYISTSGTGKMFAEGFIVSKDGTKAEAPESMMLDYW